LGAAVPRRGTLDAGDYTFISPLLFYKHLCDVIDAETHTGVAKRGGDKPFAFLPVNHGVRPIDDRGTAATARLEHLRSYLRLWRHVALCHHPLALARVGVA
jgi:hypothetical protein